MHSTKASQQDPNDDFLANVVEETRVSDLLLILSVPICLLFVFLLPGSIQNALVVDYQNPSIFNLWSAAFVHRGFNHFINNITAYCILIIPVYLLFISAGERELFRKLFILFLILVPVTIASINVAVIPQGTGAGFSGIGSAFFGLLPVSLFLFIHNRISEEVTPNNGVCLFLIAAGIIALIYLSVSVAAGIILVAGLLTLYDIYQIGLDEVRSAAAKLVSMKGYFELALFTGLMFLISPLMLFPQDIVQSGHIVNIFSHYLGLAIGFFGPTIFLTYR